MSTHVRSSMYLRVWYVLSDVKKVKHHSFLYISLASWGPPFCVKVFIWIDLGDKYGTKFGLLIIKKNVEF